MERTARAPSLPAALLLGAAALLSGGCAFARRTIPLDGSGIEVPGRVAAGIVREQWRSTRDGVAGAPKAVAREFRDSWRALTDPGK